METITELLGKFMLIPAPSGYEAEMAHALRAELSPFADSVRIDRVGNVIAKITGKDPSLPPAMLYAHMDSLGFVVRKLEPDGFIRLERLGGVPEKVLPGLKIVIRTKDGKWVPAAIGVKSHHATPPEEKYRADPIAALYADAGARSSGELLRMGVDVGCPAVYAPSFERFSGNTVCGTALDDRGGCACLVRAAALLAGDRPARDTYIVGTVWEEFNLRGAMLAARTVKPVAAVCLDVLLSGDTPDLTDRYDTKVGLGPGMLLYSFHGRGTLNGTIPHEGLARLAEAAAEAEGVALQRFASTGLLTDSAYLQLEGEGVASLELGFPARYTHSPVELCDAGDIEALSKLAAALMRRLDGTFNPDRY